MREERCRRPGAALGRFLTGALEVGSRSEHDPARSLTAPTPDADQWRVTGAP